MSFTTVNFVIFMTVVFIAYFTVPKKAQPYILLAGSYVFYGFASIMGLAFLIGITLITYLGATHISKINAREALFLKEHELERDEKKAYKNLEQKHRKKTLILVVALLIAVVVGFKYLTFIFSNIEALVGVFGGSFKSPSLTILLPVGLSFYTFMSMGYFIDVYRGTVEAEHNLFKYALFVAYFPQVLQGPIAEYKKLAAQLYESRDFDRKNAVFGIQRVMWGFFKKLVIANTLSYGIDQVFRVSYQYTGIIWIFVMMLYGIQLYADFSGYMDIACGCSQMFGITIEENFDTPYFSKSIAEFWRRWHMSLGAWFKNYVFYPALRSDWLNNMRKKYRKAGKIYLSATLPNVIALLITWVLIGAWHGASWNYIVYGLFHGFFVIMDSVMSPVYTKWRENHQKLSDSKVFNLFRIVRTFAIVTIGYCIFRAANLAETAYIYRNMFNGVNKSTIGTFIYNYYYYLFAGGLGTIVLFLVDLYHVKHPEVGSLRNWVASQSSWKRYLIYIIAIIATVFLGAYGDAALNQFAYFQF